MSTTAENGLRVLVVDDDPMVRAGLTMMLDGAQGIRVVGEAADGADTPEAVSRHGPHVVLMDLRMPRVDGITATRRLRSRPSAPAVIVLTTFDSDDDIVAALRAGAQGFLLKDTPPPEIVRAIQRVARGEPMLSASVVQRLMDRAVVADSVRQDARQRLATLTDREREVAIGVADGRANAEIARSLHVSVATVKAHVSSILTKLTLENRTQLALLVRDAGTRERREHAGRCDHPSIDSCSHRRIPA